MRLFVAIDLSEEMKKSLAGTMHELKKKGVGGNYVPMQNMHLTLAFLGEVEDVQAVKDALAGIKFKPFQLSLSELGNFDQILWAGVKGNQGLSSIAKMVRDALDQADIPYDHKKFAPHITLIRKATGKWQNVAVPKESMMVKKISLMSSTIRDGKPVYKEIFSV
ncbi:MAG: RNA 2',3'-cyclic phosphodiesterase [Lachnospiraceae bacterium]|nr:RNA 2',3'-cyclic phosphodiesterase [Eubacterium sp.]MBR6326045.1 RNA 2',3'-cyclic phosphodiesterase [Lachnospiraceae bacterium]